MTGIRLFLATAFVAAFSLEASAQLPQTRITSVFPPGGQQGASIDVAVGGGTDLDELDQMVFSHPGITAAQKKDANGNPVGNTFTVSVAADVASGLYDVRVKGLFGISNPRMFRVDTLPEIAEVEPNNAIAQATPVTIESVVNGRANGGTDVDFFRISVAAGQTLVIRSEAARIDSPMQPILQLFSSTGRRIAESRHSNQLTDFYAPAERLLARDEAETADPNGQDVRDTFALADVIVNTSDPKASNDAIGRFVELLFGNTFHTPTRDEQGMYCAQAAAYRSASLARQVGACICRPDGSVVALGTNEVARPGGAQYWCDDEPDGRDFRLGYDRSDRMRENLLGDILQRLRDGGWLAPEKTNEPIADLVKQALRTGTNPIMKGAQFNSTIDFIRAVHAEMAAITSAAHHGLMTQGCSMYTTTFPCHDCAKHIVAAGIGRLVYVEPYPKSLVQELHPESISVDAHTECEGRVRFEPFVGIAPKRYGDLFALLKRRRKTSDGAVAAWRRSEAVPTLPEYLPSPLARVTSEQEEFERFKIALSEKGILKEPK